MKPILILALGATLLQAQNANVLDPDSWPRTYEVGGAEVAIYMPQILEWTEYRHLTANAAIAVKFDGAKEATFGAAQIKADTFADLDHRVVRVGSRTLSGFRFPELDADNARKAEEMVRSVLRPDEPLELPLESMTAAVARGDATTGDTAVSFEPPPIFYSDSPAALVIFLGEPKLEPVTADDPSLMFAANTNWDILFADGTYHLLAGDQWLVTSDLLKGPWTAATSLPDSFQSLPDDGNWSEVKARLHLVPGAAVPAVFASDRPSEIIVTEGKPQLIPISGTSLMYVSNSESDLFLQTSEKKYYFLTAGRWFGAPSLEGPWSAASNSLPADFTDIPPGHPKASVLASVKGTPEADEAVILASIPQTASVDRSTAAVDVAYDGEPAFKAVPGTEDVEFAINTSYDVFRTNQAYYCCYQGVWFQAPAATGKWIVSDNIPASIYGIPPESPKHHVTYVHVYDSTPETVQVGTTSGYSGSYVANGLLVFGLGLWVGHELADNDNPYWYGGYYPSPCWYGYGCGAIYNPIHGYYRRGAHAYGPYGGAGFGAAYNPRTGTYARGAYAYGPYGAAGAKAAYNPWTRTGAARAGASTPYGSWGRSAVVRDDEWIRAGHRSNPYGTVGGIQTSRGGAAVGVNRKFGSDAIVGKTGGGDVYVGKDGNVYRRNEDGWQKRNNGGWQGAPDVPVASPYKSRTTNGPRATPPASRPAAPAARPTPRVERPAPVQRQTRPTYTNRQSTPAQLNRDAFSRQRSASSGRAGRGATRGGGGRRR